MGSVKHTPTAPESVDGQVIFKDILITQSTVKIRRKLQKWAFGPNQDLESLLKTATTAFYNRDEEGKKGKAKGGGSCHSPSRGKPAGSGNWK